MGEHARGGLGRILKAIDLRLKRKVALKELLRPDEEEEARFMREALIIARLQHPAIIPIQDMGRWESSGKPYYAMKMVSGRSLAEFIEEKKTVEERLAFLPNVIAVADAIAYAHSQRIIHRDLNPANVLVGPFGETVVIDWGLAVDLANPIGPATPPPRRPLSMNSRGGNGARLTITGAVLGTAEYMPVEQAEGKEVDERADVYSIGAMLYHLVAGVPPYDGPNSSEIMEKVIAGPPAPLQRRQSGAPEEIVTIVGKAMAREARNRYPTAKELAEDLRRFQTGQLVSAHPYSPYTLARRWMRRNRLLVAVAAVCLSLLTAMGLLSGQRLIRERLTEASRNELLLVQASSSLEKDPTAALAWLKRYPSDGASWQSVRDLVLEAQSAGVAKHVFRKDLLSRVAYSKDGSRFATADGKSIHIWEAGTGREVSSIPHNSSVIKMLFSPDGSTLFFFDREGTTIQLWSLAKGLRSLWGHENAIEDIVLSRDGKLLASSSQDKTVRIWSTVEVQQMKIFRGHDAMVRQVSFSPDGAWVASAGADSTVRLWNLSTGGSTVFRGHAGEVGAIAVSHDGRTLASAGFDGLLSLWDTVTLTGRVVQRGNEKLWDVAFSPSDQFLAASSQDGSVSVWDLKANALHTLRLDGQAVDTISFSPDNHFLVSGSHNGLVALWDVQRMELIQVFRGHKAAAEQVLFSPDGKAIASASWDKTARIWIIPTNRERILRGHTDAVMHVAFAPNGALIATGARDNSVRLWETESGNSRLIAEHKGLVYRVAFSPDGRRLASASWDKTVGLWDVASGVGRKLIGHENAVWDVAFSPDGKLLASAGADETVRLWDINSGQSQVYRRHEGQVRTVLFSPDGKLLASAGADGVVRLWDVATGSSRALLGHQGFVPQLSFSRDSQFLASAGHDRTVRVWDLLSGSSRTLEGHTDKLRSVAFSPVGKRLASAGEDAVIRIWSIDGSLGAVLRGHKDWVQQVAFSPDGRLLASASADQSVRIWEASTGMNLSIQRHSDSVRHVTFSPDGKLLASASVDRTVRLWATDRLVQVPAQPDSLHPYIEELTSAMIVNNSVLTP